MVQRCSVSMPFHLISFSDTKKSIGNEYSRSKERVKLSKCRFPTQRHNHHLLHKNANHQPFIIEWFATLSLTLTQQGFFHFCHLFCPRKRAVGSYEMTNWSHFPWSWDQSSSASNPRNVDCAFPFEEGVSRNLHSSNSLPRPISDDFDYVIHQDPRLVDHSPMIPWSTYSRVLLPTAWSASANDWYWGRRWLQGDSGHLGGCWSSNPWIGQSISLEEESMTQNLMRTRTALWGSGSDPKAAFFDIFRWVWLSSNGSCGWMDHGLVKKMTWEMESPGNPVIFFKDCGFIQCEIPREGFGKNKYWKCKKLFSSSRHVFSIRFESWLSDSTELFYFVGLSEWKSQFLANAQCSSYESS